MLFLFLPRTFIHICTSERIIFIAAQRRQYSCYNSAIHSTNKAVTSKYSTSFYIFSLKSKHDDFPLVPRLRRKLFRTYFYVTNVPFELRSCLKFREKLSPGKSLIFAASRRIAGSIAEYRLINSGAGENKIGRNISNQSRNGSRAGHYNLTNDRRELLYPVSAPYVSATWAITGTFEPVIITSFDYNSIPGELFTGPGASAGKLKDVFRG